MKGNPVRWFEIYVQDMARAKRFYESVFQVALRKMEGTDLNMWGFPSDPDHYGVSGTLVHMQGVRSGGSTLVYFACDDCAVEAARVEQAGGRIAREKFAIGEYGFIALAVNTEDNMIGLHSMQ